MLVLLLVYDKLAGSPVQHGRDGCQQLDEVSTINFIE